MLFFQGTFLIFFAATALLFAAVRNVKARVLLLLAASYVFYAAWDWRFLGLILGSTLLDFLVGRALPGATAGRARWLLAASLVGNLGCLGVFKYLDFGIGSLNALLGTELRLLHLTLPVGISFYTFQSMSYTLDIYRGATEPVRSFTRFALFVSFFPQLVAGPIVRAATFLPQIDTALGRMSDRLVRAAPLFVLGLFKKIAVADNLAPLVEPVFANPSAFGAVDVVAATLAFAAQVYCDFSGYTDMAIALGLIFGFRLPENFQSPYLATSPQDFWRRWHISLSTWLRDYLFTPLTRGPMRRAEPRYENWIIAFAQLVTMTLCGLWHGAGWTFVLWGAYHGVLLVAQRSFREGAPSIAASLAPFGTALFLPLSLLGWLLFRAESLNGAGDLLVALTRFGAPTLALAPLIAGLAFVAIEQGIGEWSRRRGWSWEARPFLGHALAGVALPLCVLLRPVYPLQFIYFQF